MSSTNFIRNVAFLICLYSISFLHISSARATDGANGEGKLSLHQESPRLGILKLVLSPLLVPLLLPIFIVGIGLLIFFLVTGASLAAGSFSGRNYHSNTLKANPLSSSLKLAQEVLKSEECVKRISCEIVRMTQGDNEKEWIVRVLKKIPGIAKWAEDNANKIFRSVKQEGVTNCKLHSCHVISAFQKRNQ